MRTKLAICAALVLATTFAFADVRNAGFLAFDDDTYVTGSPHVRNGWTLEGLRWSLTAVVSANWHPLTLHSHMLDVELFGLDPRAHHAVALAFHVVNTVLVFLLFARMTGSVWRSAFVAALFGIHPAHVESVAWISERKDVLSTLLWLGCLHAWVSWVRSRSPTAYVAALVLLCAGLLAKSMLVTLPFVLLLFDVWPLGRLPVRDLLRPRAWLPLVREKLPFFAAVVAIAALALLTQRAAGPMWSLEALPLGARLGNALVSYARYLGHVFWPADLAVFYPHPLSWPPLVVAGSALLLLGLSVLAWWQRARAPWALVGWAFFLGTLVPTIGLVQVGNAALADRYLYVPVLGVFWTVAWSVPAPVGERARGAFALAAGAVLVACLGLTLQAVPRWRDTRTLFEHALAVTGPNPTAHATVAWLDLGEGRLDAALAHIDAAIDIEPRYALAHAYRGSIQLRRGDLADAVASLERSLELGPKARTWFQLGLAHEMAGDAARAAGAYGEGLALQPDAPEVRIRLGWLRLRGGDPQGALAEFEIVAEAYPRSSAARASRGVALEALGRDEAAALSYEQALRLDPDAREAARRLAWIRASHPRTELRDAAHAVRLAERLASGAPDAESLDLLAAAYAEAGRFEDAVQMAERARDAQDDPDRDAAVERRISLYRQHRPYRRPARLREAGGDQ